MIFPTFVTAGLGSAIPPGVAPCLPTREIPPNAGAEEYYGGPPGKGTGSVVSGYRGTSVRERQAPMRAMTVAIPLFLASLPAAAQDQSKGLPGQTAPSSPAPMTGTAVPQAPVGHRQPTQSTLPPAVRKEEDTTGRRPADDLGPIPQICKNC